MEPHPDELAGAVDLFGSLTRAELVQLFEDLAAREGESFDPERLERAIDRAIEGFYLVEVPTDSEKLVVAGPAALPRLPTGGEDLPHLLDVGERSLEREAVLDAVDVRLTVEAEVALEEGDEERAAQLLDVCYEAESWGAIDTAPVRDRLDDLLD